MSEETQKPGVVIFVAILNFISAFWWFLGVMGCLAIVLFGSSVAIFSRAVNQVSTTLSDRGLAIGVTAVFFIALVLAALFFAFHLVIGLGLLKAKKYGWYAAVTSAVLGLVFVPWGTILSILILVLFFQRNVREFFKV